MAALTLAALLLPVGVASAATFVVTNTADSGPGSLRQAIDDANANPGADVINFAIQGTGPFLITPASSLPPITDTVYLDATSQQGYATRPLIGSPDPVGVIGLARPQLPSPIVRVFGNGLEGDGLVFSGSNNNSTLRGLQVWGFRGTNVVFTGSNTALVDVNVIGLNEALADPGSGLRAAINLSIDGNNPDVRSNFIASFGTPDNVLISSRGRLDVSGNEFIGTLRVSAGPLLATPDVRLFSRFISLNLIRDSFGYGLDIVGGLENMTINHNTVRNNGTGRVNPAGIRLTNEGANSSRNNVLDLNIVTGNQGPGILVTGNAISSNRGNTITRNSIFGNVGIGIDLGGETSDSLVGDGPTPNDPGDVDSGGNELLNFPVIESATISGSELTVTGWSGHNTTIEFFAAPAGNQGRTFLASRDEGSSSDLDSTTSSYGPGPINGVDQGSDTTDRFRFVIPLPAGFVFPAGSVLTATASEPGGTSSTSEFSGPAPVVPTADLAITKGAPSRRSLGANLQYTIIVTNNGPSEAPSATITDPTPPGLTFVGNAGDCMTAFPCTLGPIPSGHSRTITTTYLVPSSYTGPDSIVNTATVSSTAADPNPSNNSAIATTALVPLFTINVEITKVGPVSVTPGTNLVYAITVTNNGTLDATDVTVTDPTPAGLTFVSNAGACATAFPCALGTIPAGQSRQITTTFAVPPGYSTPSPISNTSTLTTTVADQDPLDNQATATTVVNPPSADLSITKTVEAAGRSGDTISYVLTVTNAGPSAAQAVLVDDPTPAGLTFVSNTGACTTPFPCSLGALAIGETRTITATFTVGAAGAIVNTASVSASTSDPVAANNTAAFTAGGITGNADVQLTKTASTGTVAPDGTITYVLAATNLGPEEAADVTIQDATPAGTVFASVSPSPGGSCTTPAAGTAGTVRCVWSDPTAVGLAGARSLRLAVRVAANAVNGTSILNTGGVTTTSVDPVPGNNSASAGTTVYVGGPAADIEVQKTLVLGEEPGVRPRVGAGLPFVFRMRVFNRGPLDATGIVARDIYPAGLQPLESFVSQGSFDLQTGFWTVGDLPQGGMAQLDLYVVASQLGALQNTLARTASGRIDPDAANDVSAVAFEVTSGTEGGYVRYYSEGATGDFFKTTYSLTNPNPFRANVSFRFQRPTGGEVTHALTLAPFQQIEVDPATIMGMESTAFATIVAADLQIITARTMSWDRSEYGVHRGAGVARPRRVWYMAEGATLPQFSLFYLLQNPGDQPATVTIRYLLQAIGSVPVVRTYVVPPRSRYTIGVHDDPALANQQLSSEILADTPIVVERAMYRSGPRLFEAGDAVTAAPAPASTWFFAEGATGGYFDEFLLLANPGERSAEVAVQYLLPDGGMIVRQYLVPAASRRTIWVEYEDPALADTALAMRVDASEPIVAERAMWWPGSSDTWTGGHASLGSTNVAPRWGVSGLSAGGPTNAEPWLLVANPGPAPTSIRVSLLFPDGRAPVTAEYQVAAQSRLTIAVGWWHPETANSSFGAVVEQLGEPTGIVVESAVYHDSGGVEWAAGGGGMASPIP